jgi:hypothetical protein
MSALPQKPPVDPETVEKLLESHTAQESFQILAAQIILANQRTRDPLPPSRIQTERRRISITERDSGPDRTRRYGRVHAEERKIRLSAKDLEDLKAGRYLRFQLPSEEEARYWLKLWNEGKRRMQEAAQRGTRRTAAEVRE